MVKSARSPGLRIPTLSSANAAKLTSERDRARLPMDRPCSSTFKIVCDRVQSLAAIGHFLGSEAREMQTAP